MGVTSCATLPFLPGTHVFSTVFKLLQANSTLFKHLWLVTLKRKRIKAEQARFRKKFASAFILVHDLYPKKENGEDAEDEEWEDENEQGQKLIGKPGGRKKAFQKVDMEKVMISMGISRMEVRDRVTNGELPA